ncbi:hypothetical protein GGR50DRAFT_145452 [Xylaria sp. CBS 124048]|nr:hypothetical protein GGR50DRAFT_145452 [Xylaria sp. CBS 124048]
MSLTEISESPGQPGQHEAAVKKPRVDSLFSMEDTKSVGESTVTRNSILTPASTTTEKPNVETCPPYSAHGTTMGTVPEPGKTYMIRDLDTDKIITLDDGRLTLQAGPDHGAGWKWRCSENTQGWLAFREKASGRYLGRDDWGGYRAEVTHFKKWEFINLRPVKKGGYHIMTMKNGWTLERMGLTDDGQRLVVVDNATKAARWEFIEV